MSDSQRRHFKERAETLFDCAETEFLPPANQDPRSDCNQDPRKNILEAWSGELLPLNTGTIELLPKLQESHALCTVKKRVVFGTITSDILRVGPLLDDLSSASESRDCNFDPFVVVFTNSFHDELTEKVQSEMKKRNLSGYVLSRSSAAVKSIVLQCNDFALPIANEKLPIAVSRTVLQVFIYNLPNLQQTDAVCIIDDDKRLSKGWTPFTVPGDSVETVDIMIGRDLRTPPNPSLFSIRTNLIDMTYNLDLIHTKGEGRNDVRKHCLAQVYPESSKFDWYYDLSSSRTDHLEMPVYTEILVENEEFPRKMLHDLLTGTPLCRDVIPLESGDTLQRGGCMVILNQNTKSFEPLALQQHAPRIHFSDGTVSHSRRSDSFWCKQLKNRSLSIATDKKLFVYHDNRFDPEPTPSSIRKIIAQEILGGILCREVKWRKRFKDNRLLEIRSWLARVKGLLVSLRNRPYCNDGLVRNFITPLEEVFDLEQWEKDVFSVIESAFTPLQEYQPKSVDFAKLNSVIKFNAAESKAIEKEWNRERIGQALKVLKEASGKDGVYVGIGSEGVSFRVDNSLFKVFDLKHSRLAARVVKMWGASYLACQALTPILERRFYEGESYRGGHGGAMVKMLREFKRMKLYHKNLTPYNMLLDEEDQMLKVVDIGRDVKFEGSDYVYQTHFREMCKRAFLCFRFGEYARNPYTLLHLRQWMREEYTSVHLAGFEPFMRLVYDSEDDIMKKLEQRLDDMNCSLYYVVGDHDNDEDSAVLKLIVKEIDLRVNEIHSPVAVVIEDPFHHTADGDGSRRRPLWFYRRHLCRLKGQLSFLLREKDVVLVDPNTFQEYVKFHIFVLEPITSKDCSPSSQDTGCFLMIKSCPLEYQSILADVRRSVLSLESLTSFKSIVLVADLSKINSFLRQYGSADIIAYKAALQQIRDERLVDHIVMFDGNNSSEVVNVNEIWLGTTTNATHSELGQHYASTFLGFQFIQELKCYAMNDVVMQMDSDIILHCENDGSDSFRECIATFDDPKHPKLVSFAFPTLSRTSAGSGLLHCSHSGKLFRFEIRCSFVHLSRMMSMLPLKIPTDLASSVGSSPLKGGWWHTLDFNIQNHTMETCRGSVGDGRSLYFIHPPNDFKCAEMIDKLSLVSDMLASNRTTTLDLERRSPWVKQLNKVNLLSIGKEWFQERHESIVVAIDLSNASYGSAIHCFDSLARTRTKMMFRMCGIILFDNGSTNTDDVIQTLFDKGKHMLGSEHLSTFAWRKLLPCFNLRGVIRSMCLNASALVFIARGGDFFDLRSAVCLLPCIPLNLCRECGSYYDQTACQCYGDTCAKLNDIPCTFLPIGIPSSKDMSVQLNNAKMFGSESFSEGKLRIEISVLVNGLEKIKGAEKVCVRIHSECLTGDVFYSQKCDCGQEKLAFLQIMAHEEKSSRPSVFIYIKGHEGRGAGLCNKIKAYKYVDDYPTVTHVAALGAIGCESDIRRYDLAVRFIKLRLQVKSIRLFTNNPNKMETVRKYFGSQFSCEAMPAVSTVHNKKYLKEKIELLGHRGLL